MKNIIFFLLIPFISYSSVDTLQSLYSNNQNRVIFNGVQKVNVNAVGLLEIPSAAFLIETDSINYKNGFEIIRLPNDTFQQLIFGGFKHNLGDQPYMGLRYINGDSMMMHNTLTYDKIVLKDEGLFLYANGQGNFLTREPNGSIAWGSVSVATNPFLYLASLSALFLSFFSFLKLRK